MSEHGTFSQDERVLAGLAHASILLGLFSNGVGGIIAALVIWLTQREKSAYVAAQALQALVYQAATFVVIMLAWCCWGALWMLMLFAPLFANPAAYETALPAGFWVGLLLMVVPLGLWGLTIVYGLWGAARCFGGHDFLYILIGSWVESQNS
jgi:uncharacterized Tic20 family protein